MFLFDLSYPALRAPLNQEPAFSGPFNRRLKAQKETPRAPSVPNPVATEVTSARGCRVPVCRTITRRERVTSEQGCLERVLQTGTRCRLEDMRIIANEFAPTNAQKKGHRKRAVAFDRPVPGQNMVVVTFEHIGFVSPPDSQTWCSYVAPPF